MDIQNTNTVCLMKLHKEEIILFTVIIKDSMVAIVTVIYLEVLYEKDYLKSCNNTNDMIKY